MLKEYNDAINKKRNLERKLESMELDFMKSNIDLQALFNVTLTDNKIYNAIMLHRAEQNIKAEKEITDNKKKKIFSLSEDIKNMKQTISSAANKAGKQLGAGVHVLEGNIVMVSPDGDTYITPESRR